MAVKNYIRFKDFSLFYVKFMYIDTNEHLGDRIFINHKIRVYFSGHYANDNSKYQMILCKVKKKDEDEFIKALSEITDKMLLMGNTDYEKFCEETISLLEDDEKKQ